MHETTTGEGNYDWVLIEIKVSTVIDYDPCVFGASRKPSPQLQEVSESPIMSSEAKDSKEVEVFCGKSGHRTGVLSPIMSRLLVSPGETFIRGVQFNFGRWHW